MVTVGNGIHVKLSALNNIGRYNRYYFTLTIETYNNNKNNLLEWLEMIVLTFFFYSIVKWRMDNNMGCVRITSS